MESLYDQDVSNPSDEEDADADAEVVVVVNDGIPSSIDELRPENSNYNVLSEADIRQRMEDVITGLSTVLSVSKDEAGILLRHYKWSFTAVTEAWFLDTIKTRKRVGLSENPPVQFPAGAGDSACGICSQRLSLDGIMWANCAHSFCGNCLATHIGTQFSNPAGGFLTIRCPDRSCGAALSQEVIDKIATEEQRENFSRMLLRSFVEHNKGIKWCPREGCKYAIELSASASTPDVTCLCSHSFCWNCLNEYHHPVTCDTVAMWMCTIFDPEISTRNMIVMSTKPCPNCKRPIENPGDESRVICIAPCYFVFCWECLEAWDIGMSFDHTCNPHNGLSKQIQKQRESASKYFQCYNGWEDNDILKTSALFDLETAKREHIGKNLAKVDLNFLVEAWKQIVKCRQILRWTYVYKYFIPENEEKKIQLFDILLGQAIDTLEKLHSSTERGVCRFILTNSEDYNGYRRQLVKLTAVTGNYFQNFVKALDNDLYEVNCKSDTASIKIE
ncbi:hypothetical protein SLEP1_g38725 [Rubroshorea leprosula]|uniref:RBR-type E3 ubiquitin transferase n=1 Tax=Rubroshorea leprosula TaxID=152421 RepID=A0AAV5KXV5_9ROSI|nr:hypothetical protein SLEP1_g38725 [Rubroshorea leprosula]